MCTVVGAKEESSSLVSVQSDDAVCTVIRASSTDERHYAAMCMQSMYRRRMEEREKQAMASVFQPQPQLMYTGHRNSRTMVGGSVGWGWEEWGGDGGLGGVG